MRSEAAESFPSTFSIPLEFCELCLFIADKEKSPLKFYAPYNRERSRKLSIRM